jgi:hypothetical protein
MHGHESSEIELNQGIILSFFRVKLYQIQLSPFYKNIFWFRHMFSKI